MKPRTMWYSFALGIGATMAAVLAPLSHAQESSIRGRVVTEQEFEKALSIKENLTRGLVVGPDAGPAGTPAPALPALTLDAYFEFDSTTLSPQSRQTFDNLGRAIQGGRLNGVKTLTIEGHTDGIGTDAYNNRLSEMRALAVRDYLVMNHGIPLAMLRVVGKGKQDLADPANPRSGVNRRVRLVASPN